MEDSNINNFSDNMSLRVQQKKKVPNMPAVVESKHGFIKPRDDMSDEDKFSKSIKDIGCGLFHTVALTNAGELWVWGSNEYSQHGIETSIILKEYEELNKKKKKVSSLPPECFPHKVRQFDIKQNKKITHVATGSHHIIAVENNRKPYGWGRNIEGQLGIGKSCRDVNKPTPITELIGQTCKQIACSEAHTLFLNDFGEVFAFGSPQYGRLGLGLSTAL